MIPLTEALKHARRGIHVHGQAWRVAIICDPRRMVDTFNEVHSILDAGSLKIENANYATYRIDTEKQGIIRCYPINDLLDAYRIAGQQFAHLIWVHTPLKDATAVRAYMEAMLRSDTIPSDKLLNEDAYI